MLIVLPLSGALQMQEGERKIIWGGTGTRSHFYRNPGYHGSRWRAGIEGFVRVWTRIFIPEPRVLDWCGLALSPSQ